MDQVRFSVHTRNGYGFVISEVLHDRGNLVRAIVIVIMIMVIIIVRTIIIDGQKRDQEKVSQTFNIFH
tara:strand:+ start:409 stop:612 length:204 start_codon:yes stop_codon:yes gene_type:complete